jgi:hypothetical protein
MGKGTGLFWLGKGTLGEIRQNEEIPAGIISPERMKQLVKQELIGEKIKPVKSAEDVAPKKKPVSQTTAAVKGKVKK